MKNKASVSNDEVIIAEIRDNPEFAASYLAAAMEETDEPGVLLIALRQIAEARGGMAKVAKDAGIQRESLYRALSKRGNPRLTTLLAIVRAMGWTLTITPFAAPAAKTNRPAGLKRNGRAAAPPALTNRALRFL